MSVNLSRFKDAQKDNYPRVYSELKTGKKRTHWMWYMFPQIHGLGKSSMTAHFAIKSMEEAKAYLEDDELYNNLVSLCDVLLETDKTDPVQIFGKVDALKLQSSMTLFSYVAELNELERLQEQMKGIPDLFAQSPENKGKDHVFAGVLDKFYNGERDRNTENIIFFDIYPREMADLTPPSAKQL